MESAESNESNVIYLHTKKVFIDKWAKRFVKIYKEESRDRAIEWAMGFLPREAIQPVAVKSKQLFGKV